MNIVVKAPVMADKIKELLDGYAFDGALYKFVEKRGLEMIFSVSGDNIESMDMEGIVKSVIKSTDYGKGIFFSVTKQN